MEKQSFQIFLDTYAPEWKTPIVIHPLLGTTRICAIMRNGSGFVFLDPERDVHFLYLSTPQTETQLECKDASDMKKEDTTSFGPNLLCHLGTPVSLEASLLHAQASLLHVKTDTKEEEHFFVFVMGKGASEIKDESALREWKGLFGVFYKEMESFTLKETFDQVMENNMEVLKFRVISLG